MREILQSFYNAYGVWLDQGAPEGSCFARGAGLCSNLISYLCATSTLKNHKFDEQVSGVHKALESDFGGECFPFNSNYRDYEKEVIEGACHLNPKRVQFIMKHRDDLPEQE